MTSSSVSSSETQAIRRPSPDSWAHCESSVVLPQPAGATTTVNRDPGRSTIEEESRGRATPAGRSGGTDNFAAINGATRRWTCPLPRTSATVTSCGPLRQASAAASRRRILVDPQALPLVAARPRIGGAPGNGDGVARPLIATKLYVPKLRRGLVARPRLIAHLRRGAEAETDAGVRSRGFGKTTLLAEWLGETPDDDRSVAWLSLDPADNEPASFWTYVVTALQAAVPGVGSSALELIASSPVPTDLVLTTLLNELAAAPGEVWLVLDDYHLVDSHEVGDGDGLPARAPPAPRPRRAQHPRRPRPAAGAMAGTRRAGRDPCRRPAVHVRRGRLRTSTRPRDCDLAARDVEALEERTEGWIAALQLAALSLRGRDDVSGFIARFAGRRPVHRRLPGRGGAAAPARAGSRASCCSSAVLDRLTGPLCDAVTGRDDGSAHAHDAWSAPTCSSSPWTTGGSGTATTTSSPTCCGRACSPSSPTWFRCCTSAPAAGTSAHDLAEEAVRHALAARDFDRAAHLMELAVPAIRRHRQEAMMLGWLKALPDDNVRRSPVLSVFYGSMLMVSGDLDAVEPRLDDAERALAAVPDGIGSAVG